MCRVFRQNDCASENQHVSAGRYTTWLSMLGRLHDPQCFAIEAKNVESFFGLGRAEMKLIAIWQAFRDLNCHCESIVVPSQRLRQALESTLPSSQTLNWTQRYILTAVEALSGESPADREKRVSPSRSQPVGHLDTWRALDLFSSAVSRLAQRSSHAWQTCL